MSHKSDDSSDAQVSQTQRLDGLASPDGTPTEMEVTPDAASAEQVAEGPPRSYGQPNDDTSAGPATGDRR
jgi:hypothetical protein